MSGDDASFSNATRLVHSGRCAVKFGGAVNPPIKRASTLLCPNANDLYTSAKSLYGRMGTEVHETLKDGLKTLENAQFVQLATNGLSACALSLASCVRAGDEVLLTDSAYGPTRRFCERYLSRMGVTMRTFNPRISAGDLEELISEKTRAIFFEMPGSLTFEMHDIRALLPLCQEKGITTILDNTWAAGIFFRPLDIGVDISVQALTKYVIGHSDGFGGAVMTNNPQLANAAEEVAQDWGLAMSPDDAYLAQRGLRTLETRITAQGHSALELASWLEHHPAVERVFHPALPSHMDHLIWKSVFSGASGLFAFTLKETSAKKLDPFFEALKLFGFGFSWGGFESLMIPCDPQLKRSASPEWLNRKQGSLIRVSIGLESTDDLKADLSDALSKL